MHHSTRIWPLFLLLLLLGSTVVYAADEEAAWAPTPPRVSYLEGQVSYWRPGAKEWATVSVNLPMSEGDALYSGSGANFEVQFGSRSFARADENSELTLVSQSEGFIQFKVSTGLVSFDMRTIAAGRKVEVSTPDAVFVIADPGYYRVEVDDGETHFITRDGGQATVTTADGRSMSIHPSEDIVVTAGTPVQVATYAAPPADAWDSWNQTRSDRLDDSLSARYLAPNVYGAEDLDQYGYWRVVPTYGEVWIPYDVNADWTPYSTGYWVWDPYYEWSWVDSEPWGWAPFHYGRWVFIDGYWAWAPGPVVAHAVYAPALVGFLVAGSSAANVNVGLSSVWWVALGWGEPLIPWWHHHEHHGRPRWEGWGGPHVINGREVRKGEKIDVDHMRYHNARYSHALHTMEPGGFGGERQRITEERPFEANRLVPLQGALPIKPTQASLYGRAHRGEQPPSQVTSRPTVSTRQPPQQVAPPWLKQPEAKSSKEKLPQIIYMVPPTQRGKERHELPRPPFGTQGGAEVTPAPPPPAYGQVKPPQGLRQPEGVSGPAFERRREQNVRTVPSVPAGGQTAVQQPGRQPGTGAVPIAPFRRSETPSGAERQVQGKSPFQRPQGNVPQEQQQTLPGQPANQLYRGWEQRRR